MSAPRATATRRPGTPLVWLGALLVAYMAVPVIAFLVRTAGSNDRGFQTPGLWAALRTSVAAASVATLLVAVVGIHLAYWLARHPGRLASMVGMAVQVPLALPPLMAGVVLIYIVGPYTTLGRWFGGHLTDSFIGLVIAQSFVSSPFLVISARSAFAASDPALEDVAATLGLRPTARLFRIALPAAAAGIRAGILLTWLRAFGEYGANVLLAYHPYSLPVFTYVQFSGSGIPTTQAPTLLAIGVAAAVITLGYLRFPSRRRAPAVQKVEQREPRPLPPTPVQFSLDVVIGEFHLEAGHCADSHRIAIVGPSGSGKSMTLRSLAGLLGPRAGPVCYGSRDVTDVATEARRVGYVPQTPALLASRTVWQQVTLAPDADPALARWWLAALGLAGLERRLPSELSGGQRQRVLLAQALSREPDLVLLDEPFSALDAPVREELRRELRRLQRDAGLSTVLVTHDPEEAALLADEILVIVDGRIVQAGPRREVFTHPVSPAVGRLLGVANLHTGRLRSPTEIAWGELTLEAARSTAPVGTEILWTVAPDRLTIGPDPGAGLAARVVDVADRGTTVAVEVEVDKGGRMEVRASDPPALWPGQPCRLLVPPTAIRSWPAGPGAAGEELAGSIAHDIS